MGPRDLTQLRNDPYWFQEHLAAMQLLRDRGLVNISQPTHVAPGNPWKTALLTLRAEAELPLFHPHDSTGDQD